MLVIAFGLQAPLLWGLGRLLGHPGALVALAAPADGRLPVRLLDRTTFGAPGPLRLYLVQWPFFIYWTAAMFFALLAPFALAAAALARLPLDGALAVNLAVASALTAASFIHRTRVVHRDVSIASLPAAFEGYRIVQLTDLHCGPFASRRRVDAWVAKANRLEADLVAVTGDLIASARRSFPS